MSKSKQNVKTPDEVTRDAEDDSAYQGYLSQVSKINSELDHSHLMWYWRMGEIYNQFTKSQANNELGSRTIKDLIADLANQRTSIKIASSTLLCAKQLRDHYKREDIANLVESGIKVGHLKLIMPLKDSDVEEEVTKKLVNPDGSTVTIRELKEIIDEAQHESVVSNTNKSIEQASEKSNVAYQSEGDEEESTALKTPEKGEHKTGKAKEFSISPLRAFRAFDKHAIATIASIGDAYTAAVEGTKVGFDSDRAQKNFREAFDGALGTAEQLIAPLQKLIEEMKQVRKDV